MGLLSYTELNRGTQSFREKGRKRLIIKWMEMNILVNIFKNKR
jgi:hypothetical protein